MMCTDCGLPLECGMREVRSKIGRHKVVVHMRCAGCENGHVELSSDELEHFEQRAAAAIVSGCENIDPVALKFARKALGLTQAELGAELGVAAETISRWETGTPAPKHYRHAIGGLLHKAEIERAGGDPEAWVDTERLSQTG